jgi:hypothetical protein
MEHEEVGRGAWTVRMYFVHDPDKCRAVVNTVMNLRFPQYAEQFLGYVRVS